MSFLDEKIYGNALNLIPTLGPVSLTKLYNYFGSFVRAWNGSADDYLHTGLPAKAISEIIANKQKINPEQAFAELARQKSKSSSKPKKLIRNYSKKSPQPLLYYTSAGKRVF